MYPFPRTINRTKRRAKPTNTDPPINSIEVKGEFLRATTGPVPHKHHEDPGAETDPGLLALTEIFKWILGETARLLDDINQSISSRNQAQYDGAILAFKAFVNKLNDETDKGAGSSFGPTINAANIDPIPDSSGYYISAKVVVQWQGGTHSDSSMIHVP